MTVAGSPPRTLPLPRTASAPVDCSACCTKCLLYYSCLQEATQWLPWGMCVLQMLQHTFFILR